MKTEALHACIQHWSERTENGNVAFRFKTVRDADLRASSSKKRQPAPPSDEEPGDEDNDDTDLQGSRLKMKRPLPPSNDEHVDKDELDEEAAPKTSKSVEVNAGKGKAKALPVVWYDGLMYDHWISETHFQSCIVLQMSRKGLSIKWSSSSAFPRRRNT